MNNLVSAAQHARQNLSQGLSALQQQGAPPGLIQAAQPIAEAMSALHNIEASQGASAGQFAPVALDATRRALASLQNHNHPAAAQAVNAVASSLNLIHQISQAHAAPPPMPPQAHAAPPPMPPQAYAAPPPMPPQAQPAARSPQVAAPAAQPQASVSAAPLPPVNAPPGTPRVNVELGAHSPTNFYKGLAGNDIIDAGGIFVATYQIPNVGQPLLLHLSMPGGYEFQALGVVRWAREAPLSSMGGTESPPGFGAQFTEISPEARQLVYRYVRNREPLFYDDF
ncbi:MAG: PilZ domain-containing protein [Polyangiaceae bacterium]|nr:PilZ domain-containing protein [Polyangiaceae bacterium]